MTKRHTFSSALRLLHRPPPSASYSRSFSASRPLTKHVSKAQERASGSHDHDSPGPSPEARRNRTFTVSEHVVGTDACTAAVIAQVRTLMRSVPHPLTAIVATAPSKSAEKGKREPVVKANDTGHVPGFPGLLVSSFNTVAMTPVPFVSFNIKLPSTTYDAIKASTAFTASGLRDARVADAFVKRGKALGDVDGDREDNAWHDSVEEDGRLKVGKGGTWWMRCQLIDPKCTLVSDHVIVVAKVMETGTYDEGERIPLGLVYAEGLYRKVGQVLRVTDEESVDFNT